MKIKVQKILKNYGYGAEGERILHCHLIVIV
jgi:hypothetical protein